MAKFCTNCGKELDENAAMCLNCGVLVGNNTQSNISDTKNEKKKGLPVWAIVLIVVGLFVLLPMILIIMIAVFAFTAVSDNTFNELEDYIEESIVQRGTIDDTLRTDDFKITLTDALMYDSIGENEYLKDTPLSGKEYLIFFFDVENISNENQYITGYDFSGYVDGYSIPVKYLFNDVDGIEDLSTNLAPGKKAKGYIAFEVDTTWKEFEIHYDYEYDGSELVFAVRNNSNDNVQGA